MFVKVGILSFLLLVMGCYEINGESEDSDTDSESDTAEPGSSKDDDVDIETDGSENGEDTTGADSRDDSTGDTLEEKDTETEEEVSHCATMNMIDDMETASGRVCPTDARNGVWYVFHDDDTEGEQFPPITEPGIPAQTSAIPEGRDGSLIGMHTYGEGFDDWGAGIGLDLSYNDGEYGTYDASAYTGVAFWARSDLSTEIEFRVSTPETTLIEWGGSLYDYDECWWQPHSKTISLSTEWALYEVFFEQLRTDCWASFYSDQLTNIQFLFSTEYWNGSDDENFDFWIDDVSFFNHDTPCCDSSPPECRGDTWPIVDETLDTIIKRKYPDDDRSPCNALCWNTLLSADDYGISALGGLECYHWLTSLSISDANITDLSPLSQLTELYNLDLINNQINDLTPLSSLGNLIGLYLSDNQIEDLTPLSSLIDLYYLDLKNNRISDITPLENLVSLLDVSLDNNNISDLTPLVSNPAIGNMYFGSTRISLENNPIDCASQKTNLEELKRKGVIINGVYCN